MKRIDLSKLEIALGHYGDLESTSHFSEHSRIILAAARAYSVPYMTEQDRTLVKLLRGIADETDAKESRLGVIFLAAAERIVELLRRQ